MCSDDYRYEWYDDVFTKKSCLHFCFIFYVKEVLTVYKSLYNLRTGTYVSKDEKSSRSWYGIVATSTILQIVNAQYIKYVLFHNIILYTIHYVCCII